MTRAASLGMYDDGAAVQAANDALWRAIAACLAAAGMARVPASLDRARPLAALWDDPALLLAQCCGYPLVTGWRGRLRVVATPRYGVTGCDGGDYRSRIVVRADDPARALADLRGRRAAYNSIDSNSGLNLLRAAIAPVAGGRRFFSAVIETGSHRASAERVAAGEADAAAIDIVTYAHLRRDAPDLTRRLRTLAWTQSAPGLPLVTAAATTDADLALLRGALAAVAAAPDLAAARATLLLDGFSIPPTNAYDAILAIEDQAIRLGYPALA